MRGQLRKPRGGWVPKQLADVIDLPIGILIVGQQAIVWPHPARLFRKAIAIQIEHGREIRAGRQLEPIPIQIQHQGIDSFK